MSDSNPYQSPEQASPRPRNYWAIGGRIIGGLLVGSQLGSLLFGGVCSIWLLAIGVLLLVTGSTRELFFPPTRQQIRRQVARDLAKRAGDAPAAMPPEDFLRQLEQQDRSPPDATT